MLAALERDETSASSSLSPARAEPSASTTVRPLRAGSGTRSRASAGAVEQRGLPPQPRCSFSSRADLRQLRLRLLRLRLLVAEALDEALEPGDVLGDPLGGLRRVRAPARLLPPPDVPRAGKKVERGRARARARRSSRPRGTSGRARRGSPRRRATPARARATRGSRRRGGSSARRAAAGRVAGERAGERGARELAARERVQRPVEVRVGEAEAADGRPRDRASGPATRVPSRACASRVARSVAWPWSPPAIASSSRRSSRSSATRSAAPERAYSRRVSPRSRRPLVVEGDARALGERELAALELGLTGDRARSSVVFPAPLGPERATRSRRPTANDAVEERVSRRSDPASATPSTPRLAGSPALPQR